jgi:hypothetical protein
MYFNFAEGYCRTPGLSSGQFQSSVAARSDSTAVIARLDRAIQHSRDGSDEIEKPRRTGSPGQAG